MLRESLARASHRFGYADLPTGLLRYVLFITAAGVLAPFAVIALAWQPLTGRELLQAGMLLVMATISERFPLHLTHKTNINITSAAVIVMILLLPVWVPGLLVLIGAGVAQSLRRAEVMEAGFNVGQTVLYVTAGAICYGLFASVELGPRIGDFGSLAVIAVVATVMHLLNTGMVAVAGGLQLGLNPLRVWASTIALDVMPHVTLTGLGTIAAMLAVDQPLALPFLALPAVLVHQSVRQTVQLRVDTHEALASLVEVMELRDPYTAGHSRRVAALSRTLATRLGLTEEEADVVEHAGRVHDIGKAGIDQVILTKPGQLSDVEWNQMRNHPDLGANVVSRFAAYRHGAKIVRHHHESWDGSGYPDGLTGEQIPLGSRIIAVADTFDALTSSRPYRDAMSIEDAISVLEAGAGLQWDERVVSTMVSYLRDLHGELPTFRPAGGPPVPVQPFADPATGRGPAIPTPVD
ncbi:MAG TPA: HD-GYP domain-containing protein [Thermomicrobiales bacterium]|nr:HD-GYP domain-containing protein [Thermomicrobiales bacterium]